MTYTSYVAQNGRNCKLNWIRNVKAMTRVKVNVKSISFLESRKRIKYLSTLRAAGPTLKSDISRRWNRINAICMAAYKWPVQTSFTNILHSISVRQKLAKQQHDYWRTVERNRQRDSMIRHKCGQNKDWQPTVRIVLLSGSSAHPTPSKNYLNDFYFLQSRNELASLPIVFISKFAFFLTTYSLLYHRL
jgi:hypothetical protein